MRGWRQKGREEENAVMRVYWGTKLICSQSICFLSVVLSARLPPVFICPYYLSSIRLSVWLSVCYCTIVISALILFHFSVFLLVHNNYHMHTSGWSIFSVFAFCIFAWDQAGGMHVLLGQQASSLGSLMNNNQSLHQQITSNQLWPAWICIESLQIRNWDFLSNWPPCQAQIGFI